MTLSTVPRNDPNKCSNLNVDHTECCIPGCHVFLEVADRSTGSAPALLSLLHPSYGSVQSPRLFQKIGCSSGGSRTTGLVISTAFQTGQAVTAVAPFGMAAAQLIRLELVQRVCQQRLRLA